MTLPLLILRPQPGADATAARAAALGLEAIVRPLFAIEPGDWSLPDEPFEAVMLTSANAAQDKLRALAHLPLYAVGTATAEAAGKLGFQDVGTGAGDVASLVEQIVADGIRTVLHPAGKDVTDFDSGPLRIIRRTAYAAVAIEPPALPQEAVALLHSARAARRFVEIVPDRAAFAVAAISPAVLDAAGPGWRASIAAESPDDDALLAAAARLCQ